MLYFDFNDFKPFNDTYGFRQGDRAILIFAELLQKHLPLNSFIGHIGGDDFFVGFSCLTYEDVFAYASILQDEFKHSVISLYNKEDISNNCMVCMDRFNVQRKFDLLSVSCAIIEIGINTKKRNFDYTLGKIKKISKKLDIPVGVCL
jgi:GGDEF domain-containing protein